MKTEDLSETGKAMCPRFDHGDTLDLLVVQQAGHKGFMKGSTKRSITIEDRFFIEDVSEIV